MKKIILASIVSTGLFAGNLGLTGFAFSKHKDSGYNEEHNWIGVRYSKQLEESLYFTTELATFKNSYNDRTYILGEGLSYTPFKVGEFNLGGNLTLGIQKGYCMDNLTPKECINNDNDVSLIAIPSLEANYNLDYSRKVGINFTYLDGLMCRFYFDLKEW